VPAGRQERDVSAPVAVAVGFIGKLPIAGMSLYNLHYLAGLRALGYDVHYVERANGPGDYYDVRTGAMGDDVDYALVYVPPLLARLGVERFSLIDAASRCHGSGWGPLRDVLDSADFVVTLADPTWFDELERCPRRAFVDGDPMFTQVRLLAGDAKWRSALGNYDVLFSYGTRIGAVDCAVPDAGRRWIPTRPVVHTASWSDVPPAANGQPVTALVQWSKEKTVTHDGAVYGPKNSELERVIELPGRSDADLLVALAGSRAPVDRLRSFGWHVADAPEKTATLEAYRAFIAGSRADLGIAKQAYVGSRCGWFSDRSTCFLAAGRPVLHQDTGFSDWLPVGDGVLQYSSVEEAIDGIRRLDADYGRHTDAARRLAREHFEAREVVATMLEEAGWR
jgi:hypothetical protein